MRGTMLTIIVLFAAAIGTSYAYAYEESVFLPRSDYVGHQCYAIIIPQSPTWTWLCEWDYTEPRNFVTDIPQGLIEADPESDTPDEDILREIKKYLEPTTSDGLGIDDSITAEVTKGETPTEEDEEILDAFEKCFGGLEQSFAFQMEYEFEKFVRDYQRYADKRDKLAEECIAISHILNMSNISYPGLVVREDTSFKTKDYETQNFPQKSITPTEREKTILDAQEYMCSTAGKQRGLCITEFDGTNRGGDVGKPSEDVYNQFSGKSGKQIYDEYLSKRAADTLTKQDLANLQSDLERQICEIAWRTSGYGGIAVHKWRTFLQDGWCDDKLTEEFMLRTTFDKFSSLADARDHRLALDDQIKAGRQ